MIIIFVRPTSLCHLAGGWTKNKEVTHHQGTERIPKPRKTLAGRIRRAPTNTNNSTI